MSNPRLPWLAGLACTVVLSGACAFATGGLSGSTSSSGTTQGSGGAGGATTGHGGTTAQSSSASSSSSSSTTSTTSSSGTLTCGTGKKLCGTACAPEDPMHGCASDSCTPCSTNHATEACNGAGACVVMSCAAGYADCNDDPSDGCEVDTSTDPANCNGCGKVCAAPTNATAGCAGGQCGVGQCLGTFGDCNDKASDGCETDTSGDVTNCGACKRACASTGVASLSCAGGLCTSTCVPGKANCSRPTAPAGDDGCETDATQAANCGGCGNACTDSAVMTNPQCLAGMAGNLPIFTCGCTGPGECKGTGTNPTCTNGGLCVCGMTTCGSGEVCAHGSMVGDVCSCRGGAACAAGQTCCDVPAACVDTTNDVNNCGGCGHVCPPGFDCIDSGCGCAATDANCNAGAPAGTFSCHSLTGPDVCMCGTTQCSFGQRCQADGSCG